MSPFDNCFLVCSSPVELKNASPFDCQSWATWGPIPWVLTIKVGALDVWTNSFLLE